MMSVVPDLTENRSGGLEGCDDSDGGRGGSTPPGVQSYNVPNNGHDSSLAIGKDEQNTMEQSSVSTQEQFPSNCDNFVTHDNFVTNTDNRESSDSPIKLVFESNELNKDLENAIENKKGSNSNSVSENCDQSERKVYLNLDSDAKRTLKKDSESNSKALPPANQRPARQKPGVILLGRGNSFSLGRSEVIVLHHRPKSRKERKSKKLDNGSVKEEQLTTIDERRFSVDNDDVVRLNVTGGSDEVNNGDYSTIPSPSPPPVSNGLYHPDLQQNVLNGDSSTEDDSSSRVLDLVPCYEDDLQDLWHKAESMMALRNGRVRKILEEFGIGEPGGGGGEEEEDWEGEDVEERKKEEEEVWQIVQENFRV